MASSTTKPTESVSASSVMLLIENPNAYIAPQVPTSETGTASEGMRVADAERRNRKITSTTSATAISSVSCTSTTEARIEIERSLSTSMLMAAGTWVRKAGNRSLTESTTATVLASGWRWMASTIGAPVVEPARDLVVLDAVDDAGDFLELDRRAVAVGHHDLAVFLGLGHRPGRGQREVLARPDQRSHR